MYSFMMLKTKDFNYSYWEIKQYFRQFDLIVIGSGIVGLSTAIAFKQKHKKASILILERGCLPNGASTKNAGFACFGSPGELADDLTRMTEETVWDTVKMRWNGLQLLRKRLGDKAMAYKPLGGFELFDDTQLYDAHCEKITYLNKHISETISIKNCFTVDAQKAKQFKGIAGVFKNNYEGQIDTSLMMSSLTALAHKNGITLLNNVAVLNIQDLNTGVDLYTNAGIFKAGKVVVATNGFAGQLLALNDLKPARAQVLVTKPIKGLKLKGAFHYQQGYYYFRNIDDRILFGGGRNLDPEGETTTSMALNATIQNQLDLLLKNMILPQTPFEVEHRWSGIMGVGSEKKPIIAPVSNNVLAAVRMGGMGIAIGSLVGEIAAGEIG
jgi:gamma-glutamylputrescine oxidase